ncbi:MULTISPECIES: RDD family protein [Psychrobacter]|uniref:RDD family protein n=1 Tax=Psychrobacter proteolyticus TaxID=147825 RepID=A0ABV0D1V5_9GAMM|nr:RDD family protein [Psychrobacter sp. 230]TEW86711.1 RDD family protein [Psychrobacter sp. 230]|tara:strand:- start:187 stop:1167 length:981 start_codon:yes stop_codon:yes gene_type:complete
MQAIMQIFLARNNVQAGPYQLEQLNIMLASGEVLLDDLMWHEGLAQWQRVGDLTNNQTVYRPTGANTPEVNDSIINNVTVFPEDTNKAKDDKSVSLDRLYGKPERPKNVKADMTTNRHQTPHNNVSLNKSTLKKAVADNDKVVGNVVLAPIMSRVLATALNGLLYILAILPLVMALTKMDVDYTKFQNIQDMDAAYQYSMTLMESLPSSTLMMSQVMVFGLFALQLVFITMRGQSLGKLITGIRVVDQTTHRLPSFIKLIGTRTLLLFIIYNLLFSFTSFLGFVIIAIHYYMASKSPENIGWHDKLAKTLVVKADSSQLVKKSKSE